MKCYLSKLMGIHKMNIQDVHEKTGLHRNTIASLYHEKALRIELNAMEKLCKLFNCQPGDLFEYIPEKE
jgi:putative transcriptional regulator